MGHNFRTLIFGAIIIVRTAHLLMKKNLITLLPRLRRFARNLTRSDWVADNLVRDACLQAMTQAELRDPAEPLDQWVFGIIQNLWCTMHREQSVCVSAGQGSKIATIDPPVGDTEVLPKDLQVLVSDLPLELAAALLMVSVERYSYAEVADLFDIPKDTVMERVHRARVLLSAYRPRA
jgi:RNA polymerase sigma-70 factor (ECF subfamily)